MYTYYIPLRVPNQVVLKQKPELSSFLDNYYQKNIYSRWPDTWHISDKECPATSQFGKALHETFTNTTVDVEFNSEDCDCRQWAFQFLQPKQIQQIPSPNPTQEAEDRFLESEEEPGTYCRNESFIFTAFRSFLPYLFYLLIGTTSIPLSEPPEETTTLQPEYDNSSHSEYGSIEYGSGDYETYPQYDDYESDDVTPTPTLASDYHYPDYRERDGDYEGGARCGHKREFFISFYFRFNS